MVSSAIPQAPAAARMPSDALRPPSVAAWQVALVIGLAIVLGGLHWLSPAWSVWGSLVLFLLGVPHGAVERHPARPGTPDRKPAVARLVRTVPTVGYTALYLVVALLFFCSWLIDARLSLGVFLLLSALHFSASEPRLKSVGLWVVLGSLLVWTGPTLSVFSAITARDLSGAPLPGVALVAAAVCAVVVLVDAVRHRDLAFGTLMLGLFAVVPPVAAVAIYYFAVHSMREWREVHAQAASLQEPGSPHGPGSPQNPGGQGSGERARGPLRAMARLYAPFSVPVLLGGAGMIALAAVGTVPLWVAAGLGMAIAVPHMAPFEQWVAASRDPTLEGGHAPVTKERDPAH